MSNYGPNSPAVEALIARSSRLTDDEIRNLYLGWHESREQQLDHWDAAINAARLAARATAREDAWDAAINRVDGHGGYPNRLGLPPLAAKDAAAALVVADLAGLYGLHQRHVDTLMAPWLSVVGETDTTVGARHV